MTFVLIIIGLLFWLLVAYDFIKSTISLAGQGPVSGWIAKRLWKALRTVGRGAKSSIFAPWMGPTILIAVAIFWVFGTWLSWSFIILAADLSVAQNGAIRPATWYEGLAYIGAQLSTAGNSRATAAEGTVDILGHLAALQGMLMLTLSVSYLYSVTSIVRQGRNFAIRLAAMRKTIDLAGARHWSGSEQGEALAELAPSLVDIATGLRAFPIAAYFAPTDQSVHFPSSVLHIAHAATDNRLDRPERQTIIDAISHLSGCTLTQGNQTEPFLAQLRSWYRTVSVFPLPKDLPPLVKIVKS